MRFGTFREMNELAWDIIKWKRVTILRQTSLRIDYTTPEERVIIKY